MVEQAAFETVGEGSVDKTARFDHPQGSFPGRAFTLYPLGDEIDYVEWYFDWRAHGNSVEMVGREKVDCPSSSVPCPLYPDKDQVPDGSDWLDPEFENAMLYSR